MTTIESAEVRVFGLFVNFVVVGREAGLLDGLRVRNGQTAQEAQRNHVLVGRPSIILVGIASGV